MTNKEAIETIKIALAEVEWEYPMDYPMYYAAAFDMAIEALEKQVPKKPEITAIGNLVKTRCNICGFTNSYVDWHTAQYKYCPSCGRAIDWSDEE